LAYYDTKEEEKLGQNEECIESDESLFPKKKANVGR